MVDDLLKRSYKDFMMSQKCLSNPDEIEYAAYFLQQAIEKCLKVLLYSKTRRKLYKHDIGELSMLVENTGVKLPETIVRNASTISEWESKTRYSFRLFIDKNIIQDVIISYTELYDIVLANMSNDAYNINENLIDNLRHNLFDSLSKLSDVEINNYLDKLYKLIPNKLLNDFGSNKEARIFNFYNKVYNEVPNSLKSIDGFLQFAEIYVKSLKQ